MIFPTSSSVELVLLSKILRHRFIKKGVYITIRRIERILKLIGVISLYTQPAAPNTHPKKSNNIQAITVTAIFLILNVLNIPFIFNEIQENMDC